MKKKMKSNKFEHVTCDCTYINEAVGGDTLLVWLSIKECSWESGLASASETFPDWQTATWWSDDCNACHFLPKGPRAHGAWQRARLRSFTARIYSSFTMLFPPLLYPRKALDLGLFIKWVHGSNGRAPAPIVSHRPSAGSKSSIHPSYERHVERTMGVTLRGALRDNCLTIQGATLIVSLNIWSFFSPSALPGVTF